MAYNELNTLIDTFINRNGVQAITGQILNGVLKAMVQQLGAGYSIGGVAEPSDDPGTPDAPVAYFASEPGTYTDFDGITIAPGEFALLCYDLNGGWSKSVMYEGFQSVGATVDGNTGTPAVNVTYNNGVLSFAFSNLKGAHGNDGNDGDAAGFGTIGATVDGNVGTPGVTVQESGPNTAKNLQFNFTNLKGETGVTSVVATVDDTVGTPTCTVSLVGQQLTLAFTGLKGAQGDTGSSVDYPFTIVNNLTTNDATQALSAAQGKVLKDELGQLEAETTLNTSSITKSNYTISGTTWYNGGKHFVIPVTPGQHYIIEAVGMASNYAWLTSSYTPPASAGGAAPLLANTKRIDVAADTRTAITVPTGAAYLYLVAVTGGGYPVDFRVYVPGEIGKTNERISEQEKEIEMDYVPINTGAIPEGMGALYQTDWYYLGSCKHKVVPVTPGDRLKIKPSSTSPGFTGEWYGWLTASYVPPQSNWSMIVPVPFVSGTERVFASSDSYTEVDVPQDAAYICLVTLDGGGLTATWDVSIRYNRSLRKYIGSLDELRTTDKSSAVAAINEIVGEIESDNSVFEVKEISGLTEQDCIPANFGNGYVWYHTGKHIAIPVNEGEIYLIRASQTVGVDYSWLTSSYSAPVTPNASVPMVTGSVRITVQMGKEERVVVPHDAAYLVVATVNGGGVATNVSVFSVGKYRDILDSIPAETVNLDGEIHEYDGEKITITQKYGLKKVAGVTKFYNGKYPQGLAIYGGYMFRIYDTGECEIYDISDGFPSLVTAMTLACSPDTPHCNAAQFAPTIENGNFPYLYVCACKVSERKCYVLSVDTDGSNSLIQTITFPVIDALPDGITFNAIIGDDGFLYTCGHKGTSLYFAKFKTPATSNSSATLTADDLVASWKEDFYDYTNFVWQGMCVYLGKLFLAYGGSLNERGIWAYNTESGKRVADVRMSSLLSDEFEDVAIYGDKLYLQVVDTSYYILTF